MAILETWQKVDVAAVQHLGLKQWRRQGVQYPESTRLKPKEKTKRNLEIRNWKSLLCIFWVVAKNPVTVGKSSHL